MEETQSGCNCPVKAGTDTNLPQQSENFNYSDTDMSVLDCSTLPITSGCHTRSTQATAGKASYSLEKNRMTASTGSQLQARSKNFDVANEIQSAPVSKHKFSGTSTPENPSLVGTEAGDNPLLPAWVSEPFFIWLGNRFFIAPEKPVLSLRNLTLGALKYWALASSAIFLLSLAVAECKDDLFLGRAILIPLPAVAVFYFARGLLPRIQNQRLQTLFWRALGVQAATLVVTYSLIFIFVFGRFYCHIIWSIGNFVEGIQHFFENFRRVFVKHYQFRRAWDYSVAFLSDLLRK